MDEQCASAAAWPEDSIFAATRAEHGHYVLAMWRCARKLSQAQTATLTSLDTETVTKLYHTLRPAALDTTINLGGAEMLGGGDRVVVIDEARVARRKYRRGRAIPTHHTYPWRRGVGGRRRARRRGAAPVRRNREVLFGGNPRPNRRHLPAPNRTEG